jgi:hypothetical protein
VGSGHWWAVLVLLVVGSGQWALVGSGQWPLASGDTRAYEIPVRVPVLVLLLTTGMGTTVEVLTVLAAQPQRAATGWCYRC